jgi:hypothetical protein
MRNPCKSHVALAFLHRATTSPPEPGRGAGHNRDHPLPGPCRPGVRLVADAATAAAGGHDSKHHDHYRKSGQCGSDPESSAREWHFNTPFQQGD